MTRKDRKARAGALGKGTSPVLSYFFRFTMLSTLECLLSSKEKKKWFKLDLWKSGVSRHSFPFESLCGRGSRERALGPASTDKANSPGSKVIDREGALATSGEQMGKQSRGKQGTIVKEMLKSQLSKYCRLYPGERKKKLQWKIDQVQNILNIINTGGLGQGQWAYLACPRYCICSHSRQIYFLT